MSDNNGSELAWDAEIENEGNDFVLLPDGAYPFTVTKFERGRFPGSEKLGACNKAVLSLEVDGGEHGKAYLTKDLLLHTKLEWLICQFFTSIGQRKKGEKLRMNWDKVIGSKGRLKLAQEKYIKKGTSEERFINKVDKFLEPAEQGYTPGKF
ncbi:hypothetical protein [Rubellicoccus peritrichatus]|uniref:DUF669 domain-containing protein n=1 Tax=Rubellicoccus peritrichatus TaxID=3080537 RepID=A0AAQ3L7E6_9BACT|nr:hypothetical protein [Puniceicoccus sp. CR14]WOO40397.1 hypothetical protein RZN69_17395 [Puniceicoccus sp. CR14]WOO40446.1 hypothetical protein RZN69_17640 [Puniceicoccus sp. CR14]WOO40495.1 hypothetical protein RZN69_17885 [Puniceicoccus sp. CR14]